MLKAISAVLVGLFAASANAGPVLINEFAPNPTGGDPSSQQVELLGMAGTSFNGTLLTIETDDVDFIGNVDRFFDLSGTFDSNGLLTFTIADLENPSFLMALVGADRSLTAADNVDNNGDGILDDISAFGTVYDAISISDEASDVPTYAAQLGGTDFAFTGDEPQLVFRDSVTQMLYAINDPTGTQAFDSNGNQIALTDFSFDPIMPSFGAASPTLSQVVAVPAPATALLMLGVIGAGSLLRRRT